MSSCTNWVGFIHMRGWSNANVQLGGDVLTILIISQVAWNMLRKESIESGILD